VVGGLLRPLHRDVEEIGQVLFEGGACRIKGNGLLVCGQGLVEFPLLAVENAQVIVRGSVIGEGFQEFP